MSRKILSRARYVVAYLARQGFEIGIALFVTQLVQELHRHPPAINRLFKVEDKDLEQRLAIGADRRPHAEASDACSWRGTQAQHADGKDSRQRGFMAQHDIGRRKAEPAPELIAVRDTAADRVRTSEQTPCVRELACSERASHRGARGALTVDADGRHRLDAEACRLGSQQSQISASAAPEAEILADEDPSRTEAAHEH